MGKNLMDSKTVKLSEILFNGRTYKVPPFQRNYSWKEENWEDLWEDILNTEKTGLPHYMGAVIFKVTENEDELYIIDGQQRLASIIVLAVACIKFLEEIIEAGIEPEKNKERVDIFSKRFIGDKDATSLFYKSKLVLNRNDNPFFQEYILKRKKPRNLRKLKESQKLLWSAFEYFYKKIKEKFQNDNGENISKFLEKVVAKKLVFIQITVEDDLSAYTVFETLNARGIELAPTDLLKNYIFSLVAESDIENIEEKWYRIIDTVGFKKFPTFLRYFLNSYRELVRKDKLFKILKREIKDSNDVMTLLDDLEEHALLYAALNNPYDEFWNDFIDKARIPKHLEALKIFGVTQHIPLIMAVYRKKRELMEKVLRIIVTITFRYNVIGKLNPNDLEKVYNRAAIKISEGKVTTLESIFKELKSIYVSDDNFVSDFTYISINTRRNKKLAKYILVNIENYLSGSEYDYDRGEITIEHILPENPSTEWFDSFSEDEIENFVYRVGNLTLLESSKNRNIGNKPFPEKIEVYETSKFQLTKNINYDEWNKETITRRQKYLASLAKQIWRIDIII
jgi:uncharacterized protein with ParB-like and HNH nuclease domain